MPYRIDIPQPPADAFDRLVELGALDVEPVAGGLAAILPDGVMPQAVERALAVSGLTVSAATARDSGSVWLLRPRPVRIGSIVIAPAGAGAPADALRLADSAAFGTGHHPTTVICVEALEEALASEPVERLLDVGTGSGILALAALRLGVPSATGVDIDPEALKVAAENARLNGLSERLQFVTGGPDAVNGTWPLVVANFLAAPLIEMAPTLARRVASRGRIILSGIPASIEPEVRRAYEHLGMRRVRSPERAGWAAIVLQTSW